MEDNKDKTIAVIFISTVLPGSHCSARGKPHQAIFKALHGTHNKTVPLQMHEQTNRACRVENISLGYWVLDLL